MGHGEDHPGRARAAARPRLQRLTRRLRIPSAPGTTRLVEVAPERLAGWVERFAAGHGGLAAAPAASEPGVLLLRAVDGASAELTTAVPEEPSAVDGPLEAGAEAGGGPVARLAASAARSRTVLLLLVRRGGFAVGLARDGAVLDSASGTRYVQARTAAGGWSQQRYARRRSGQAAVLTGAAADAAARLLARADRRPEVLVPGGDRLLVAEVLTDPRLAVLAALPAGPLLDVADPRRAVLVEAARRARAVRVLVRN